jgi:hypothetical protein
MGFVKERKTRIDGLKNHKKPTPEVFHTIRISLTGKRKVISLVVPDEQFQAALVQPEQPPQQ